MGNQKDGNRNFDFLISHFLIAIQ